MTRTPVTTRSQNKELLSGLEQTQRSRRSRNKAFSARRNLLEKMAGDDNEFEDDMSLEQLRQEVDRLRQLNQFQNLQLIQLRQQQEID